jgi:hypothetical protein
MVTIGGSVKTIGNSAFGGTSLANIIIPDSVETIGDGAFSGCESLMNVIIGKGVRTIGEQAFVTCISLINVSIPNSVETIGEEAFSFCDALKNISIGDSVTEIGDGAFSDCELLESILIPNNVTSIGSSVFYNCSSLVSAIFEGDAATLGHSAFQYTASNFIIYFYEGATEFTEPMWEGYSAEMLPLAADRDSDGWTNRLERAFGSDPVGESNHLQVWLSRNDDKMQISYGPHSDKVSFTIKATSDLSFPADLWPSIDGLSFSGDDSVQAADLPALDDGRMFYRIEMTEKAE